MCALKIFQDAFFQAHEEYLQKYTSVIRPFSPVPQTSAAIPASQIPRLTQANPSSPHVSSPYVAAPQMPHLSQPFTKPTTHMTPARQCSRKKSESPEEFKELDGLISGLTSLEVELLTTPRTLL
jgi:hypothetical protein